jgi:hypothetical protein
MEPIFDLEYIRSQLDSEDWEDDEFNDCQKRAIYIGSVFSLVPSGKYYTPWANSNVDNCPCCHGTGTIPGHPSARIRKRNQKRYERMLRLGLKLGREYSIRHASARKAAHNRWQKTCSVCEGIGSKEAHDDKVWYEQAEEELSKIGCWLESGEGDPCDLFVVECRDIPEDERACDECS